MGLRGWFRSVFARPEQVTLETPPKPIQPPPLPMQAVKLPAQPGKLEALYQQCSVKHERLAEVSAIVGKILINRAQYEKVERGSGVPWFVVACIHNLESSLRFTCHLHEGSPLTARTVNVPKNRPKAGKPPFLWHDSAIDALSDQKKPQFWDLQNTLDFLECYNGLGYRKYHSNVPSPYLFSFTSVSKPGKYSADGRWDASLISKQVGAVCVLKILEQRGLISFAVARAA